MSVNLYFLSVVKEWNEVKSPFFGNVFEDTSGLRLFKPSHVTQFPLQPAGPKQTRLHPNKTLQANHLTSLIVLSQEQRAFMKLNKPYTRGEIFPFRTDRDVYGGANQPVFSTDSCMLTFWLCKVHPVSAFFINNFLFNPAEIIFYQVK